MNGREFERVVREHLSARWGVPLGPRIVQVGGVVPKSFDLVSGDGRVVGDAKWYAQVPSDVPAAMWATIAEYVWLLQRVEAERRFLIFGNDERVPRRWLDRFGALADPVEFWFFDGTTARLLQPEEPG
jgi:hypothetical protein